MVLGVSVKNASNIAPCYERFLRFMRNHHGLRIEEQRAAEKWLMPHIRPGCNVDYGAGRVLFAGEAAGFLNPMGEGISVGMESGYCAACAAFEHFDDLDKIYTAYQAAAAPLKTYMERQWGFVAGIATSFGHMKL